MGDLVRKYFDEALAYSLELSLKGSKKRVGEGGPVTCCKCGLGSTTLYKQPDGTYICKHCKEEKDNV